MLNRCQGFNLIEVLIVIFILSFGLLALAGLQLAALRAVEEAYWQSVATVRMGAIFERFRAQPSTDNRQVACNAWQQINQQLLPTLRGECQCQTHSCQVTLHWKIYTDHTLQWKVEL